MTEQINSGQVVQKPDIVLEEFFPLPPGLLGVKKKGDEYGAYEAQDNASGETETGGEAADSDEVLQAPGYVYVVSQSIRIIGSKVLVDLIVEVEDVPGIDNYELRVTKA